MDQVGFEPTTSRFAGEVTLSYTTSNFFCSSTDFRLCSPPRREPPTGSQFAPDKFDRLCRGGACPAQPLQIPPGGIIEQSCGASAPHRLTDEVTLPRAIP